MPPKPDEKSKLARGGHWQVKLPREYRDRIEGLMKLLPFDVTMTAALKMAIDLLEADLKAKYGKKGRR